MPDASELLRLVKQAALDAASASKPMELAYGTVLSTAPLQISVEQKMTLGAKQLVLCRSVMERTVEMTMEHFTEYETQHRHAYKGRKKFTVHCGLAVGDEVLLLRQQGGQKYVVVDKLI